MKSNFIAVARSWSASLALVAYGVHTDVIFMRSVYAWNIIGGEISRTENGRINSVTIGTDHNEQDTKNFDFIAKLTAATIPSTSHPIQPHLANFINA